MSISFINEILKMSPFLPEGVKVNFENTERASDLKVVKWKKDSKDS
jgi:hypothetical protein